MATVQPDDGPSTRGAPDVHVKTVEIVLHPPDLVSHESVLEVRTHQALAVRSRVQLREWVLDHGPVGVPEAASAVGLHPNTARVHLERLVEVGLLARTQAPSTGPGRPRALYSGVRPDGDDAGYRELATLLAAQLAAQPGARALAVEAGQRWAAATGGVPLDAGGDAAQRLTSLLDGLGFAPALRKDDDAIDLHRCPFEQVARGNRTVVCGVHQGLLDGALAQMEGEVRLAALEPFADELPLRCVVRLASTGRGDRAGIARVVGEPPPDEAGQVGTNLTEEPPAGDRHGEATAR